MTSDGQTLWDTQNRPRDFFTTTFVLKTVFKLAAAMSTTWLAVDKNSYSHIVVGQNSYLHIVVDENSYSHNIMCE